MTRRVIGSVLKLFNQLNQAAPNRKRDSDGTFPSPEHHQQNPGSDHEPHLVPGVGAEICTAGDYTHDPANGADMAIMTEELRRSRDPRIKYVIFRDRMFSSYPARGIPAWTWRDYSGTYHGNHAHLSTLDAPIADTWTPWRITMALELDQDIDFTALKNRVLGIQQMSNPIYIGLKDKDGKPRLEENKLAAAVLALGDSVAMVHTKLDQILTLLKATPDPEGPSVELAKAALQAWMATAVEANADPGDASP